VIGDRVNDAVNELKALGFKVEVPNYNSKGHVFEQSPKAGETIPKGSTITLIL
jgi:beta-lactam-binding protein with PASTA domain